MKKRERKVLTKIIKNFNKERGLPNRKLCRNVAVDIWKAALQKSVSDSVGPKYQIPFLLATIFYLEISAQVDESSDVGEFLYFRV